MYWNPLPLDTLWIVMGLIETWDVLKCVRLLDVSFGLTINRNMRCIEILAGCSVYLWRSRLIETWDVLKYGEKLYWNYWLQINRNMRCIEMQRTRIRRHVGKWLIETWDVLKFIYPVWLCTPISRLIETWDVLKSGAESIAKGAQGD